ncbi:MAG: 4Fe-4S ferredoxin, partial [Bacillota bacterium]
MISKSEIISIIESTVTNSPHNNFGFIGKPEEAMWEKPIIGFARGDDPYFAHYKKTIGEFYWLPKEVFQMGTNEAIEDEQLTVISIGFPQTKETKADQKQAAGMPCDRWLYTRGEWEHMIRKIADEIVVQLKEKGILAVSLESIKELSRQISKDFGIASNWSHRHTAFIAGLGTFGLSDGLITEKGKAMRFTSLILKGKIDPTKRPYDDHHAYCKFYSEN